MATFKVGQRVRIIAGWKMTEGLPSMVGREATIYKRASGNWIDGCPASGDAYLLDVDGFGRKHPVLGHTAVPVATAGEWIAPLTDPRAEEFIGDMERFAKVAQKRPVGVV